MRHGSLFSGIGGFDLAAQWRNESIKAGGNAVVPQVVYQIFRVIEEIDYFCKP
jgi:hypothetical protein